MVAPVNHQQSFLAEVTKTTLGTGVNAGFGYLAARFVTNLAVNPIVATIFSAASYLVSSIVRPIFDKLFENKNQNAFLHFIGHVFSVSTAVALSSAVATGLGFPITFTTAASLAAATLGVRILADFACLPCFIASKV